VLTRKYKGGSVQVKVLAAGFEDAGQVYGSLSAVGNGTIAVLTVKHGLPFHAELPG
jgi:hypothetical protein